MAWTFKMLPVAIYFFFLALTALANIQAPLAGPDSATTSKQCTSLKSLPAKRVAIIGAGSAGASTAHYLRKYLGDCANLNVDVYERNDYIGGRSTTVNVYDDASEPIELGASIFVEINQNLVQAVKAFKLSTGDDDSSSSSKKRTTDNTPELGVWDGSEFVFTQLAGESEWQTALKMLWKYGLSIVRTRSLTTSTIAKFLKMYEAPYFPWTTLTDTVHAVGLDDATSSTGSQYLAANKISPPFSTDLIQASTRVNYAQNLGQIHGLETMVCMAIQGAMAVEGGNWQIFSEMLKHSGANVHLETRVTQITKGCTGSKTGSSGFTVKIFNDALGHVEQCYDDVVLAAPYEFAGISLYEGARIPAKVDYVHLHVTLFASPSPLSPVYFGVDPVPYAVLTTLPDSAMNATNGTDPSPFFSVSLVRAVINPTTNGTEFVYKIFSPEPVSDLLLVDLLKPKASTPKTGYPDVTISWKYEKLWHSYPYEKPRIKFEDFKLDDGLWYTSGIESFISTMETSSLSGMNVAASMKKSWGAPYNTTDMTKA